MYAKRWCLGVKENNHFKYKTFAEIEYWVNSYFNGLKKTKFFQSVLEKTQQKMVCMAIDASPAQCISLSALMYLGI